MIYSILEKIEDYVVGDVQDYSEDSNDILFAKMADFIINLDPDLLDDDQIEEVINIIDLLEYEELEESRLANKTDSDRKSYARRYYRKNKTKVITKRKKFEKSAEGRKRERAEQVKAQSNRTPTGRRKKRYHERVA